LLQNFYFVGSFLWVLLPLGLRLFSLNFEELTHADSLGPLLFNLSFIKTTKFWYFPFVHYWICHLKLCHCSVYVFLYLEVLMRDYSLQILQCCFFFMTHILQNCFKWTLFVPLNTFSQHIKTSSTLKVMKCDKVPASCLRL
jgi:hypothetical protein